MDKGRITYLIEQYLNDKASAHELSELEHLLADPSADSIVKDAFYADYYRLEGFSVSKTTDRDAKERIFQHIVSQPQVGPVRSMIFGLPHWLSYAAATLFLISISLIIWNYNQPPAYQEIAAAEITPGTNRATLSLADGRTIVLDQSQEGIIMGAQEITYNDGTSYVLELTSNRKDTDTLMLSTPKGGTYAITLPDGSKVWLNSATTLKYPSRFDDKERVVYLEGEAFFAVNKKNRDTHALPRVPFKVISNGQVVQVQGTEFNISAYADDDEVRTTLVEGRINVSIGTGMSAAAAELSDPTVLKPGEQAVISNGGIVIQAVDVEQYTAWKDGFFYFERLPPPVAIAQLARWYDLEVVYQGKVPQLNIFGVIDRNKKLDAVLKSLEKSGLRFKVVRAGGVNQLVVLGE